MIFEPRHFSYGKNATSRSEWHESTRALGIETATDPEGSLHSAMHTWSLGDVIFLSGDMRCQAVKPLSPDVSPWSADYLFLKLIVHGSPFVEDASGTRALGPGGLVLLDPQHRYKEVFPGNVKGIGLRFPRAALKARGFRHALDHAHVPDLSSPDVQAVRALIACMAQHIQSPSTLVRHRLANQLLDMMDIVLDVPSSQRRARTATAIVMQARRYIARHLGDPDLSAERIASHAAVSKKHLGRLFAMEGQTLMHYVQCARLERAAECLAAAPWHRQRVQQVATECGFASASHFSHAFKERYGMAPSDACGTPSSGNDRLADLASTR